MTNNWHDLVIDVAPVPLVFLTILSLQREHIFNSFRIASDWCSHFTHRSIQILPKPYRVMIVYIPRDTPKDNSVLIDGIEDHKTVQYAVKYAIQQFCCDLLIITSKLISERISWNLKSQHCSIMNQVKSTPPPLHTHTSHSHHHPYPPSSDFLLMLRVLFCQKSAASLTSPLPHVIKFLDPPQQDILLKNFLVNRHFNLVKWISNQL